jgi:hypothetical protein
MGIRFFCPNGHKQNVKSYLAGQTGICPTCGIKMQIPHESTRTSSKQEQVETAGDPVDAGSQRPALPMPAVSTAPTGHPDPLAEGGTAVWYVRLLSGDQFGPAAADVMRVWLGEGRISADALVWREGWREWQAASDVFPQLSPNQPIPGLETELPELSVAPVRPQVVPARRRTQAQNVKLIVIGSLGAAVVVLSTILVWVLLKR